MARNRRGAPRSRAAEAALEAERLGAAGFVTKPYDLDALIVLVGSFVQSS